MMLGYLVTVSQESGSASFEFVGLGDAMSFASTCLECGNEDTVVRVKEIKKED